MTGPADASATTVAAGTLSAAFAPTSLDRLVHRAQAATPLLARVSDVLLIVIAALFAVVDVAIWRTDRVVDTGRISTSVAFLVPMLGVLATVAVALRRRHLTSVLATVAAAGVMLTIASWVIGTSLPPSFGALFALALLTIGVLRSEPGGTAVVLATVAAIAVAAESLRPAVSAAAYLLVVSEGAFAVAAAVGIYLRWSDWRHVAGAEAARIDVRLEIARELHDLVGYYVSGIVIQAQAARHVAERRPAAAAAALENIEVAGTDALLAMRRMVGGLRSNPSAAPGASWDDVDELLADAVAQGQPVNATIDPAVRGTTPTLVPSVHRIIAESLTNARRHGHGITRVEVAVLRRDGLLVVTVHDDGSPAATAGPGTFGVVGMRERADAFGGSLFAGPEPGGGWLVRAELPMENRP